VYYIKKKSAKRNVDIRHKMKTSNG